jgi:hypothetical protein
MPENLTIKEAEAKFRSFYEAITSVTEIMNLLNINMDEIAPKSMQGFMVYQREEQSVHRNPKLDRVFPLESTYYTVRKNRGLDCKLEDYSAGRRIFGIFMYA